MISSPKAVSTALKKAWVDAEAALMRFKQTRDAADREAAAVALFNVALVESALVVRVGVKVDAKLPAKYRRDTQEMARDAVASVLSQKRTRMSVLADKHDPEKATLRTFIALLLYNKVQDYVRKEPIPGIVGRGKAQSELTGFAQSLLPPGTPPTRPASTLADSADAQEQVGTGHNQPSGLSASGDEPSHVDDHGTLQILGLIEAVLPADEYEVFVCEFHDMTAAEGLACINEKHGEKIGPTGDKRPHMSASTYDRKLKSAREIIAKRFPELRG